MLKTTYTLAEAARLLSCHPETLRRAIKEGALQAAKLGREYRISRSDLQGFWSARGGRELFGDGPPQEMPVRAVPKGGKKTDGPRQFSLLASSTAPRQAAASEEEQ